MCLSFYWQVRGWSRVSANGNRCVWRGHRSVCHQPFLLPSGPIWNRHPGMRNLHNSGSLIDISCYHWEICALKRNRAVTGAQSKCCYLLQHPQGLYAPKYWKYASPLCLELYVTSPVCLIRSLTWVSKQRLHYKSLSVMWFGVTAAAEVRATHKKRTLLDHSLLLRTLWNSPALVLFDIWFSYGPPRRHQPY